MARTAKISKNIWNLAIPAVSLSCQNDTISIKEIYKTHFIKRCSLSTFSVADSIVLANIWGQRLFYILRKLLTTSCQNELRVEKQGIIVSAPHPTLSPLTLYRRILRLNLHTPLVRSTLPMRSVSRYSHAASSICASASTSNQSSCPHPNVVEVMKTTDIRTLFRKAEKPMSIAYISKRTGMTVEECENRICDLATTCDTFAIVCKVMSRRRRFSRLREFFGLCGYEYAPAYYLLKRENSKIR